MGGHTTSAVVTTAQISSKASVFRLMAEIPAGQEVYFTYVWSWPAGLFGFFSKVLRKNPNRLVGQPNRCHGGCFFFFHQDCAHPLNQLASEIFSKVVGAMLRNGQSPQEAF